MFPIISFEYMLDERKSIGGCIYGKITTTRDSESCRDTFMFLARFWEQLTNVFKKNNSETTYGKDHCTKCPPP